MLKPYEIARILAEPAMPYIYAKTRRDLKRLVTRGVSILDVGGRRSPYTVGVPAKVTIYDLPRETELQQALGLGIDDEVLAKLRRRRSNIEGVLIGDMTKCALPTASYDGLVAVEVIEHVVDDDAFMTHAARVLKPGGWAYFTTPNGDHNPTPHPDHVRHYKRHELVELLSRHFDDVRVVYGVAAGRNHLRGLRAIDPRHPLQAVDMIVGNLRNSRESRGLDESATNTAHLFATVRKR